MNLPADVIDGAIRISLCRLTTEEEIRYFCDCLVEARNTLLKVL